MKKFNPLVSIIIPVYNGSNYIEEAITSALNQTYKNIEIIIVNDGSNDNGKTEKIIKKYGEKVRYFYKENGGVASALNFGISKMKGEYFSWLSHDDLYKPEKIETQVEVLKSLEDKNTILFSNVELIDSEGNLIVKTDYLRNETIESLCNGIYPVLKGRVNGCSVLISKKCFEETGLFDESLKTTNDYDMWFRLFKKYNSFFIEKHLIKYRIHSEQDTNKSPVFIKESNELWTSIIKNLSIETLMSISKNPFQLMMETYLQMKNSGFNIAAELAYNRAKEMYKEKIPTVSVIIPCYNSEKYLKFALDSVINQTYGDIEIIVIDDNSIDKTASIVKEYIKKDFRISLYKNKYKKGVSGALNTGLDYSRGKYIARLDSDDIMHPDKLLSQYYILETGKYCLVATNISLMNEDGKITKENAYENHNGIIEFLCAFCNPIPNATIMYKKEVIDKYNLRFEDYKTSEDFAFLINYIMVSKEKAYLINEPLYYYRILKNSLFHSNIQESLDNAVKLSYHYYKKINGVVNKYYNIATDFKYTPDKTNDGKNQEIKIQDFILVFKEFEDSISKKYNYDIFDRIKITMYIFNRINQYFKVNNSYEKQPSIDTPNIRNKRIYLEKIKKLVKYYKKYGMKKTIVHLYNFLRKKYNRSR